MYQKLGSPFLFHDTTGDIAGVVDPDGSEQLFAFRSKLVPVPASRLLTAGDLEHVLSAASGIALTIPTDAVLGIKVDEAPTVAIYAAGASSFTLVTTGLTMVGTQPTFAEGGLYGLQRVGANTWKYLG